MWWSTVTIDFRKNIYEFKSSIYLYDLHFSHISGTYTLDDILRLADDAQVSAIAAEQASTQSDDPGSIQFTSGTTGKPKAVVLSHFNLVNSGAQIAHRLRLDTKAHRVCLPNPLFHVFGFAAGLLATLHHGAALVLPTAGYDVRATLRAVEQERCTMIYGTPTMFVDLVNAQKEVRANVSSLEYGLTGGATCTPSLYKDIRSVMGHGVAVNKCS